MTDITPPPELVKQWIEQLYGGPVSYIGPSDKKILAAIAQWGADQELDACVEWLRERCTMSPIPEQLRAARCPKPPSLKQRIKQAIFSGDTALALKLLEDLNDTV